MTFEIELPEGLSSNQREIIARTITMSVNITSRILPLAHAFFKVVLNDDETIPEFGVGGCCGDAREIELALSPGREDDWIKHLPRTIAHEWHHLARWQGPGFGTLLADYIISEGLAQQFEVECFPGPPTFFSVFLTEQDRSLILEKFKEEWNTKDVDNSRWFFGKGEFPFQAGYDLSFYLVGKYLALKRLLPSEQVYLDSKLLLAGLAEIGI
jgi:uncharacterized protein YjaZ